MVAIGEFVGLHGVRGELKLGKTPQWFDGDQSFHQIYVGDGSDLSEKIRVQRVRWNKNHYLFMLEDVQTVDAQALLVTIHERYRLFQALLMPSLICGLKHTSIVAIGQKATIDDPTKIGCAISFGATLVHPKIVARSRRVDEIDRDLGLARQRVLDLGDIVCTVGVGRYDRWPYRHIAEKTSRPTTAKRYCE